MVSKRRSYRYKRSHPVLLVKGRNGKDLLMLNGYTYYQHKLLRDGFRWSCTQMGSRSCRGFLHVTNEMLVVRAHTEHTHPPSTYFLESIRDSKDDTKKTMEAINPLALKIVEFYLRPNGRINLRLNNFTFYKHLKARTNAHRWSCTAYGSKWKCKAHLIITDRLEVLKANIAHSHPPSVKRPDMRIPKPPEMKREKGNEIAVRPLDAISAYHFNSPLHNYLVAHSVFDT